MSISDEYERGIQDQRLQDHDDHFERLNGSLSDVAHELSALRTEISGLRLDHQRLTDAVASNQQTVATTALAVENERKSTAEAVEQQRTTLRDSSEKRWSPLGRMVAIATLVGAIAGLITWLISLHG
jgi:septal ring factor EnvC (AmiA/AmiB activator)